MRKTLFLLFFPILLFNSSAFSFECNEDDFLNAKDKIEEIFNNLIVSIGNKKFDPELKFSKDLGGPAFFSPTEGSITIDKKLIKLFCGEENFEDKIAFILAHELAHYYLEHGWMQHTGLSYANNVGKDLKYKSKTYEEKLEAESQADIYAGFYGLISGYNVLEYAEDAMDRIYISYNLSRSLKGYPTYNDRVKIINDKKAQAEKLANIFEIANVLLEFGKYSLSKDYYETILKIPFNSREIYNNLGLSYLMYGISLLDDDKGKLLYPVYIDQQTRLRQSKTRSSLTSSAKEMITEAEKKFERSNDLDPNYLPSKQNKFVSKFLLANSKFEQENILEEIQSSDLNDEIKTDFKVIHAILNKVKLKKIKKIAKYGSYISELNVSEPNYNEPTIKQDRILEILKIENEISKYGLFWFGKKINTKTLSYYYSVINNIDFYEINEKTYLFKIPEKIYKAFSEVEKKSFKITPSGIYCLYTKN
jgi:predicted SprT family Zn-dependent metalloprotease/phosphopantetheine adenylyltransferase